MERFYYKQNRLKQLRAFCFVAQTESMSKAAEQMFLSQPSVSLLIQSLEKELEKALFTRKGPRIKLTQEGEKLFELSLPLVEGLESLPATFHEQCESDIGGQLNIAAVESAILYLLPDIIQTLSSDYPQIKIRIQKAAGSVGLGMIQRGDADFTIGSSLSVPENIKYYPIYTFEPVLIAPLDHPICNKESISLEDISQYGLILSPEHQSTWQMVDMVFSQNNVEYKVNLEAGGWEVIKRFVEHGLGISIITNICLSGNEKFQAIPLKDFFPKRTYGLFIRKGKILTPAARKFIEIMDQNVLDLIEEHDAA